MPGRNILRREVPISEVLVGLLWQCRIRGHWNLISPRQTADFAAEHLGLTARGYDLILGMDPQEWVALCMEAVLTKGGEA